MERHPDDWQNGRRDAGFARAQKQKCVRRIREGKERDDDQELFKISVKFLERKPDFRYFHVACMFFVFFDEKYDDEKPENDGDRGDEEDLFILCYRRILRIYG